MPRYGRLAVLVAIYLFVGHVLPPPAAISPQGWRLFGIFLAVIAGQMLHPLPSAAVVLLGLTAMAANGTSMREVLGGYAEPSVWLVLTAMLMARVLMETGLARRIALVFIRQFGSRSLGVAYALVMTDVTLAAGVPSITARSAGMVMPVGKAIAELFDSTPGPTARRLGTFLFGAMYQGSVVACAMFLTGQASNILGATLVAKLVNVEVTWSSWFTAAIVPGLASCIAVPWVVYRLLPPEIQRTPQAAEFARSELVAMGGMRRHEVTALAVFGGVALLWITSGWHGLDVTMVAMAGMVTLLLAGTLQWKQVVGESPAWEVFIWYGGLLRMGELLNNTGLTKVFAEYVGAQFTGLPWMAVLLLTLLVFFYAHYFFASITAHMLAMLPPFVVLVVAVGVPPMLAVFSLLCLANLTAGLTHYGTTTGPILFSQNYVSFADWWRTGFIVSVANLFIWLTIGFWWWRWLGRGSRATGPGFASDGGAMRRVLALILGGGQGSRLFPLTHMRSKPAVPIGGKYRLIDVPISNCLHADLRRIYVLTQFNSASLNRHVANTYRMDLFSSGFVEILAAEQTPDSTAWFEGTADAVRKARRHFEAHDAEQYLILAGDHLYRMNYAELLRAHVERNADITIAALRSTAADATAMGIFTFDRDGQIVGFEEKPSAARLAEMTTSLPLGSTVLQVTDDTPFIASMGIYLFSRQVLLDMLAQEGNDFGRQLIPSALSHYRVSAYLYDGYWADVGTVESYYDANIQLTQPDARFSFYDPSCPIFTRERFLPPSRVLQSNLRNALVSDGSYLDQTSITDSVVGIRSIIRRGAKIRRSVLLGADYYEHDAEGGRSPHVAPLGIGNDVELDRVIVDKNARIGDGVRLINTSGVQEADGRGYYIRNGIIIVPKDATIPRGFTV